MSPAGQSPAQQAANRRLAIVLVVLSLALASFSAIFIAMRAAGGR